MKITKSQKGITLLELMITIAIIGIISAVAVPSIQNYTIKAQVEEAIILTSGVKSNILLYFSEAGDFPEDNEEAGFESVGGKFVSSVDVDTGAIVARFGNDANAALVGARVTLTPVAQVNGTVKWVCSSTATDKYLPSSCKPD